MSKVMMYARFERLWHWSQAVLIILMLVTGFNIHGSINLLSFQQAVDIHTFAAWTLIGLWVFAWFWHITTGEWKQYIPSMPDRILAMVRYYAIGIFQGKTHPFHKDRSHKHNPLQRMAYLGLHVFIGPAVWISGLLYLFYKDWDCHWTGLAVTRECRTGPYRGRFPYADIPGGASLSGFDHERDFRRQCQGDDHRLRRRGVTNSIVVATEQGCDTFV